MFALTSMLVVAAIPIYPERAPIQIVLGTTSLVVAAVVLACPWRSWPESRTLALVWPAFALLALSTWSSGSAALTGPFFVLCFAWLGLHHGTRQVFWCAALATAVYAAPHAVAGDVSQLVESIFTLVPVSVCVALLIHAHVRQLAEAREQMAFQATHDGMTHLPNRAESMQLLHAALSRGRRDKELVAVLYLDLDGFKVINDTMGHRAGDAVLRAVADRLRAEIRAGDIAGRLGGDEFVVVMESVTTEGVALEVAERITGAISEPIAVADDRVVRIGTSVGIRFNLDGSSSADVVLHEADLALYEAKKSGRGRVVVFGAAPDPSADPSPRKWKARWLCA
ncbi:GGDEF domain-containing protein [Nocardioides piscis]|uniref:GGDEF domain-containing protein n=1 Tax=Nocardioides piscis TaxID=2714938 RepID=A0A6G7YDG0_9ACTN|nr:GGDEF domain-containing protein [Nocardioides piscis]QIK74716.1 GGDEF domain-containing protein [Nocardioides piscis]